MKKFFLLVAVIALIVVGCGNGDGNGGNGNGNGVDVKTGKVTFLNESSYKVIIHRDAFSGPVLLELFAGESKQIDVRTSDNHGIGTIFSIEYLYRINEISNAENGDIFASGIDPNVQINKNIEENKSYTIQIPQPANFEFRTAFIRIVNAHNLPFEFSYLGTVFKQAGNDTVSVSPGKIGVYKVEDIPGEGRLIQNYQLVSTSASTSIPDFTAMNGVIYGFTYNGTSVVSIGNQTIIFN
jgi:hypothetical protein